MNKLKPILFFLAIVALLLGLKKANKDILLLWYANEVVVETNGGLVNKKVRIELETLCHVDENGNVPFVRPKTVLYDGKIGAQMPNEYGENDFVIFYDNKYRASFRQFKFNRRHQHKYTFYFFPKGDKIYVKVDVSGQDGRTFEGELKQLAKDE